MTMHDTILQTLPLYGTALTVAQFRLVVAGIGMTIAIMLLGYAWATVARRQIGVQYGRAMLLGRIILLVAALSYVVLFTKFMFGYDAVNTPHGIMYMPGTSALLNVPARFIDWAITVPLLVLELLAVSALRGVRDQRTRNFGVLMAFMMIFTGYIGGVAVDQGHNMTARLAWGGVSTVFFVIVYAILIRALRATLPLLSQPAARSYRAATYLLMGVWFVYPVLYVFTGVASGGTAVVVLQLSYCAADLIAKVGFGMLILNVARQRTIMDSRGQVADVLRGTPTPQS